MPGEHPVPNNDQEEAVATKTPAEMLEELNKNMSKHFSNPRHKAQFSEAVRDGDLVLAIINVSAEVKTHTTKISTILSSLETYENMMARQGRDLSERIVSKKIELSTAIDEAETALPIFKSVLADLNTNKPTDNEKILDYIADLATDYKALDGVIAKVRVQ